MYTISLINRQIVRDSLKWRLTVCSDTAIVVLFTAALEIAVDVFHRYVQKRLRNECAFKRAWAWQPISVECNRGTKPSPLIRWDARWDGDVLQHTSIVATYIKLELSVCVRASPSIIAYLQHVIPSCWRGIITGHHYYLLESPTKLLPYLPLSTISVAHMLSTMRTYLPP